MRYNLTQNDANTSNLSQNLCSIWENVTNRIMFFFIHTRCSCHFNFHKLFMNSNLFFIFICFKYILKIHHIACVNNVVKSSLISDFMFKYNVNFTLSINNIIEQMVYLDHTRFHKSFIYKKNCKVCFRNTENI